MTNEEIHNTLVLFETRENVLLGFNLIKMFLDEEDVSAKPLLLSVLYKYSTAYLFSQPNPYFLKFFTLHYLPYVKIGKTYLVRTNGVWEFIEEECFFSAFEKRCISNLKHIQFLK